MEFKDYARYEIINIISEKLNLKSYLEIGYQRGINYNKVKIEKKKAVDPSPIEIQKILKDDIQVIDVNLYLTTSDNFFDKNKENYDFIFIDGLHTYEQVKRDFDNSLSYLNTGGVIMLHDMSPIDTEYNGQIISGEERAKSFSDGGQWNGDCYKLAIDIFNGEYDFEYLTIDMDQGCMLVFPDKKREFKNNNIQKDYKSLNNNREEILNLISPQDFLKLKKNK